MDLELTLKTVRQLLAESVETEKALRARIKYLEAEILVMQTNPAPGNVAKYQNPATIGKPISGAAGGINIMREGFATSVVNEDEQVDHEVQSLEERMRRKS